MNVVLMVLKVGVGLVAGSVAVLSDGIDSGQDLVAALIALVSLRYGARPADEGHPYGHGRAETVAAAIQAVLIGGGGIFIVASSVYRLAEPPDEVSYDLGIVAMLIAAGVNIALVRYTSRVARETNSPAIASETRHLWTNGELQERRRLRPRRGRTGSFVSRRYDQLLRLRRRNWRVRRGRMSHRPRRAV
jgi:cation diffusion facilitator family transporter